MQLHYHGITHPGKIREANEDAFFIDKRSQLFAVADGLGGLPDGAEASRRVVELLKATVASRRTIDRVPLIKEINRIVSAEGAEAHPFIGIGTTLTLGQIVGDQLKIGHVGDSAAFHLHAGHLKKVTTDHTLEQEWISRLGEAGRTSMPENYPHTLTRCIGQIDALEIDTVDVALAPGDRILFCTDGVNKVLSEHEIQAILASDQAPEISCQSFIDAVNAKGGPDNITAILIFVD